MYFLCSLFNFLSSIWFAFLQFWVSLLVYILFFFLFLVIFSCFILSSPPGYPLYLLSFRHILSNCLILSFSPTIYLSLEYLLPLQFFSPSHCLVWIPSAILRDSKKQTPKDKELLKVLPLYKTLYLYLTG